MIAITPVAPVLTPPAAVNGGLDLQKALEANEGAKALELLKDPKALASPLPNGCLPLHFAIRVSSAEIVQSLLALPGLELLQKDSDGLTLVDHAIYSGCPQKKALIIGAMMGQGMEEAVLQHPSGSSSRFAKQIQREITKYKTLELKDPSQIEMAAQAGDSAKLKDLIFLNGQLVQSHPHRGGSSELSGKCGKELAAPFRSGESPPFTGEFFKSDFSLRSELDLTPLLLACISGNVNAVEALLKCGADATVLAGDRKGALHFAAIGGNADVVKALLAHSKFDLNQVDSTGMTPLHYAAKREDPKLLQALILNGADPLFKEAQSSPLAVLVSAAEERAAARDPLSIDFGSALMFSGVAASWAGSLFGYQDLAQVGRWIASAATLPILKRGLGRAGLPVYAYFAAIDLAACKGELKNSTVLPLIAAGNSFAGLAKCYRNRRFETVRPLRNALLHVANAAFFYLSTPEAVASLNEHSAGASDRALLPVA